MGGRTKIRAQIGREFCHFDLYSMCAHSGALKRFSGISAERTIWILIIVYVITFLINLLYF